MAHVRALTTFAVEYGRLIVAEPSLSGEQRLVSAAFRAFLRRQPSRAELDDRVPQLRGGTLKVGGLLTQLVLSDEFRGRFASPTLSSDALAAEPPAAPSPAPIRTAAELYQATLDELAQRGEGPDADGERFIQAAYHLVFKRGPDEYGRPYFMNALARNLMNRQEIIAAMAGSPEYLMVAGLPVHPLHALHQARMMLIQRELPPARRIIDIGGAAHNHPQGALLLMGYPHHPEEILIVDLPPADRIGGVEAAEGGQELITGNGIRVRYLYRSMADLADIPAASADLVVSGESIEHISEADGEIVCREVFRILSPGGSFCLDTPNAALTRLQCPDEFIHPEHQKEYLVAELRDMLLRHGFTIATEKAVCPMPVSLNTRSFDVGEMTYNIRLSDQPEEGYVFYIRAVKPAV